LPEGAGGLNLSSGRFGVFSASSGDIPALSSTQTMLVSPGEQGSPTACLKELPFSGFDLIFLIERTPQPLSLFPWRIFSGNQANEA
jgi:hypothetical protein